MGEKPLMYELVGGLVGYNSIYLHITTCGTWDRVGHSHSECYTILLYILTSLWDTGLAGQDTIDTIMYAM